MRRRRHAGATANVVTCASSTMIQTPAYPITSRPARTTR